MPGSALFDTDSSDIFLSDPRGCMDCVQFDSCGSQQESSRSSFFVGSGRVDDSVLTCGFTSATSNDNPAAGAKEEMTWTVILANSLPMYLHST